MVAAPASEDYRIEQHGSILRLAVPSGSRSLDAERIKLGVENLCRSLSVALPQLTIVEWVKPLAAEKRRRIRCVSKPRADVAA
jgi:hypothetical protein